MNAEELIEAVVDIIQDDSIEGEEILSYLNLGQLAIANRVLLPGLADGHATLSTVLDDFMVSLPTDYHRGLFLAQSDDSIPTVVKTMGDIVTVTGMPLSKDTGSAVNIVAAQARKFVYQPVPEAGAEVEIFYHRKPIPMTESNKSFPDGLSADSSGNDDADQALIYYACWRSFAKIEQGLEGAKVDTKYYLGLFEETLEIIDLHSTREGKSYPKPLPNKVW